MKPEQPTGRGATPDRAPQPRDGDPISARAYRGRGPHTKVSLDELVDMGRTVVDRVRPYVVRGVGRLRARFHRK
jgi:hypothetical protein